MKPLVEFCYNNYSLGTEKIKEKLELSDDFEVLENLCLGHCEQCAITPFVIFEGEYLEEDSPEELYQLIISKKAERKELEDVFERYLKD